VIEAWVWESEDIPYETVWRSDGTLELDQQRTDQPGRPGVRRRRVRIVYEDSEEKARMVAEEWIERQPSTQIVSYGTKIVVRELETPDGVIRYWRTIRMLATSYSAATAGKSRDHPLYGITRLGWQARKGIVAVDPRVISLRTETYVPGYGFGTAADTGGKILGRWIDLCYDEHNLVLWKRWVNVYLLEPIPPADEINWRLPDYPRERR
jgi:3D (Asp-Asp-Asp) domain-containing protein